MYRMLTRLIGTAAVIILMIAVLTSPAVSAELQYPLIIKTVYEAPDARVGGHFYLWVEREKIFYGLDPRLYPAAKSVEVTHVTPAAGSAPVTFIAVTTVNGLLPDYFHLSGNVRFKVSGMTIKYTNAQ